MIWYLLFTAILLIQLRSMRYLKQVHQADMVKQRFCELQGQMIAFLCSDEVLTLSQSDYKDLRRLLDMTRPAVHDFEHIKPQFNLSPSQLVVSIRKVKTSVDNEQVKMESTVNEKIRGFHLAFSQSLINGFFTYNPLLKYRVALQLMKALAKFGAAIGNEKLRNVVKDVKSLRRQTDDFCLVN